MVSFIKGSNFYSGIDIVAFVEKLHLSDAIVDKIRSSGHSTAGYIAISYALYKIFTPLRYTVTLGKWKCDVLKQSKIS